MAKKREKPIVAICYDFDGTLSPGNMQEYDYIPKLNLTSDDFWAEVQRNAKEHRADEILAYMKNMLDKAGAAEVPVRKEDFVKYGSTVQLYKGVDDWFDRMNAIAKEKGFILEHYILSSGIKEMIEGTPIFKHFHKVYASSFWYNHNQVACWPSLALNFTTKTQYLFRINKGHLDEWDNSEINRYTPMHQRRIPFQRMMYIGDGATDIPCMKLVKDLGGVSIAVYKPYAAKKKQFAEKLYRDRRVNFVAAADYSEGKALDEIVRTVLDKYAVYEKTRKLQPAFPARVTAPGRQRDKRDTF